MCPVHEFYGYFKGIYARIKVTSVTGHIFNCDFPEIYQDWRRVEPIDLFAAKTEKKEAMPANRIIKHLERQAKGASFVCFWLDCDREGLK
jgi:DNA topoisomerase-3